MNEQFVAKVEAALQSAGVLHAGGTLLLALSGGADSVALLYALCALREKYAVRVCAAHVEHGLRGEASLADARFCEALCARLAVPCTVDHAALSGGMDAAGTEEHAREARYRLLLARAGACKADALVLAHHQDDQAETVLAHLVRGSGARGLGGMRMVSVRAGVTLVRPMLSISKAMILEALADAPYRMDESNASPLCQRNRLRLQVLPLLCADNPRAAAHIAQSAALLTMDDDYLQTRADALLEATLLDAPPFYCLVKAPLLAAAPAITVRVLRTFAAAGVARMAGAAAQAGEHMPSADESLALLALLGAPQGSTLNLTHGLCALAGKSHVHLLRMAGGAPLCPVITPSPVGLEGFSKSGHKGDLKADGAVPFMVEWLGMAFAIRRFDPKVDTPPDGLRSVVIPLPLLARCQLRTARAGDRIMPFGAKGGKLLRRYLTDHKVDAPFRPMIPLVCAGAEVLWVAGIGAAEQTRLTDAPGMLLTVQGSLPWLTEPVAATGE